MIHPIFGSFFTAKKDFERNKQINCLVKIAIVALLLILSLSVAGAPISYCVLKQSALFYMSIGTGALAVTGIPVTFFIALIAKHTLRKEERLIWDPNETVLREEEEGPTTDREGLICPQVGPSNSQLRNGLARGVQDCQNCIFEKIYLYEQRKICHGIFESDQGGHQLLAEIKSNKNQKQLFICYPESKGDWLHARWGSLDGVTVYFSNSSVLSTGERESMVFVFLSDTDVSSMRFGKLPHWLKKIIQTGIAEPATSKSGSVIYCDTN